jgi:hypothetical protein
MEKAEGNFEMRVVMRASSRIKAVSYAKRSLQNRVSTTTARAALSYRTRTAAFEGGNIERRQLAMGAQNLKHCSGVPRIVGDARG